MGSVKDTHAAGANLLLDEELLQPSSDHRLNGIRSLDARYCIRAKREY